LNYKIVEKLKFGFISTEIQNLTFVFQTISDAVR